MSINIILIFFDIIFTPTTNLNSSNEFIDSWYTHIIFLLFFYIPNIFFENKLINSLLPYRYFPTTIIEIITNRWSSSTCHQKCSTSNWPLIRQQPTSSMGRNGVTRLNTNREPNHRKGTCLITQTHTQIKQSRMRFECRYANSLFDCANVSNVNYAIVERFQSASEKVSKS